jgi:glycosyltransferase involved in cell wall biosynthesis
LALGAGLPFIATPVGEIKEQASHGVTGLMTPAFAKAVREMMDTPACTSILRQERWRHEKRYLPELSSRRFCPQLA